MRYPNDDNGDALRRLEAEGDNLAQPRDINFSVVFPDESSANHFVKHFRKEGYAVSVKFNAQVVRELPWDVTVINKMKPSHQGITDFEAELEEIADPLGGKNDGWGCFSEPGGQRLQ